MATNREIAEAAVESLHARDKNREPFEPFTHTFSGQDALNFYDLMVECEAALQRDINRWAGIDPDRIAKDRAVIAFLRKVIATLKPMMD